MHLAYRMVGILCACGICRSMMAIFGGSSISTCASNANEMNVFRSLVGKIHLIETFLPKITIFHLNFYRNTSIGVYQDANGDGWWKLISFRWQSISFLLEYSWKIKWIKSNGLPFPLAERKRRSWYSWAAMVHNALSALFIVGWISNTTNPYLFRGAKASGARLLFIHQHLVVRSPTHRIYIYDCTWA